MKLSELYWHRITPLHILLWSLSLIFGLFLTIRKLCYWLDFFPSTKLNIPVIVVDSISTEDAGKTPLALWLVDMLQTRGLRPGIVAHGNLDNPNQPEAVTNNSDPANVGDKAILLAKRLPNACPVWVGGNPAITAQALLDENPDCNVIICTNGLQFPQLERDFEIAVVDFAEYSFGNGLLLPAGPLRANLKRLQNVDAVVINGSQSSNYDTDDWAPSFYMKLVSETVYKLTQPGQRHPVSILKNQKLHAVTRYQNAHWFLEQLQRIGLHGNLHSFDEEHRYVVSDFDKLDAETIIMPEEEAIQCADFNQITIWALPIEAWVSGELQASILNNLREKFADSEFINELICPECKCQLRFNKKENLLHCDQDQMVYTIKDGIPDLRHGHKQKHAA